MDALGSSEETRGWLSFSKDCKYISQEEYSDLNRSYDQLNAKIYNLSENWK